MTQHQHRDPLRKEHYQYYDRHDAVIRERDRKDAQLDQDIFDLLNACLPVHSTKKNLSTNTVTTTSGPTITITSNANDDSINNNNNNNNNTSKRSQRRRRRSPTVPLTMTDIMWTTSSSSSLLLERATNKSLEDTNNDKPLRKSVTFNDNVRVVMF